MTPLTKEEIDRADESLGNFIRIMPGTGKVWDRLLYTARLGAEFIKKTDPLLQDKQEREGQ